MRAKRISIYDIKGAKELLETVGAKVANEQQVNIEVRAKKRLLVVEDDESIRKLLWKAFTQRGYQVETAADGRAALTMVRQARYDLALLDVMLPKVDGFALIKRIHGYPASKDLPVVFVTARGDTGSITTGIDLGARSYVTKPFSLSKLFERVESVLFDVAA